MPAGRALPQRLAEDSNVLAPGEIGLAKAHVVVVDAPGKHVVGEHYLPQAQPARGHEPGQEVGADPLRRNWSDPVDCRPGGEIVDRRHSERRAFAAERRASAAFSSSGLTNSCT